MAGWNNKDIIGAAKTNFDNSQGQLGLARGVGAQAGANASQLYGTLEPEVSSLLSSPGFDPSTMSAITNATVGGAATPFNEASTEANNQVARTGNRAGINEAQDQLAQQKSQATSNAANQVQIENQGQKNLEQQLGLNLGQSLYGENASGQLGALNAGTSAINAGTSAVNSGTGASNSLTGPSWLQALTGIGGLVSAKGSAGGVTVGGGGGKP